MDTYTKKPFTPFLKPADTKAADEKQTVSKKRAEEPEVDRTEYNCPECKGLGLVDPKNPFTQRCPKCGGTGKV